MVTGKRSCTPTNAARHADIAAGTLLGNLMTLPWRNNAPAILARWDGADRVLRWLYRFVRDDVQTLDPRAAN